MVAIFTGIGPGTERGSGSLLGRAGLLGSSSLGRNGEQVLVNAATGNLVISQSDEILIGRGPDAAIARTYNSMTGVADDNNDRWRQSTDRRVLGLTGTVNTSGSTVRRISADGSNIAYTYNADGVYRTRQGAGAYDTLSFANGVWTWTDGATQTRETYAAYGDYWQIKSETDTSGNTLTFDYDGANLTRVTTADGGYVAYAWSGNTITGIVTGYTDLAANSGKTLTRTRYAYDERNRLKTVTVDLSPEDNVTGDGRVYVTSYGYDGDSTRVSSIAQSDGSLLVIGYDAGGRVASLTETVAAGVTRVTTLTYDANFTLVTDPQGQVTRLDYSAAGERFLEKVTAPAAVAGAAPQVVGFTYDAVSADIASVTDAAGNTTRYTYDQAGNLQMEIDRLGNVIRRTYGARNELLSESRGNAVANPAVTESFENGVASGWTGSNGAPVSGPTAGASGSLSRFLGRFGTTWGGEGIAKTFALSGTGQTIVDFDFLKIDSWDGESFTISLDGAAAISFVPGQNASGSFTAGSLTGTYTITSPGQDADLGFGPQFLDRVYHVQLQVAGTGSSLRLGLGSTLDQLVDDESWGVDNVAVREAVGQQARFVYDAANRLRFSVSPEGNVQQFVYDGQGRLEWTIDYPGHLFGVAALPQGAVLTEVQLVAWHNGLADKSTLKLIKNVYDARGNLSQVLRYGAATAAGAPVESGEVGKTSYVYDQAGNLLLTQQDGRAAETFVYDGLGRVVASVDGAGAKTTFIFNDAATQTTVVSANGLVEISTYNKAGERISFLETTASGGSNILPNASLLNGTEGWTLSNAQRVPGSAGGPAFVFRNIGTSYGTAYSTGGAVPAASSLKLSYMVKPAAPDSQFQTAIFWYDAQGNFITQSVFDRWPGDTSKFTAYEHVVVPPAGAVGYSLNANGTGEWGGHSLSIDNHLANGYLVNGTQGWGRLDNVQRVAGGAGGPSFVFRTGPGRGTAETVGAPVPAGAGLTLSYVVKPTAPDTQFQTAIYWYDAQGNFITQSIFDRWPGNVNAYTSYEHQIIPPANAVAYTLYTNGSGDFGGHRLAVTSSATAAAANAEIYTYDKAGRLIAERSAGASISYHVYDKAGRLVGDVSHLGELVEYRYDANNRLVATIAYGTPVDAAKLPGLANSDAPADLASIRPPADAARDIWTWRIYDKEGRLVEAIAGDGSVSIQDYDFAGRLIRTTSYENRLSAAQLTSLRGALPTSVIAPTASGKDAVGRSFYDKDGNLVAILNGEGQLTRIVHDGSGQKIAETTFFNAVAGELRSGAALEVLLANVQPHASDRRFNFVYDGQGLLRFAIDAVGHVTEYRYGAGGADEARRPVETIEHAKALPSLSAYSFAAVSNSFYPANILPNASLLNGTEGWTLTNAQRVPGSAGGPAFVFRNIGTSYGTAYSTGGAVPAASSLKLSYMVKPAAPDSQFQTAIFWYDAQGNFITQSVFDRWPGDTSKFTAYEHVVVPPAGAVGYSLNANGTGEWGGHSLSIDNHLANGYLVNGTQGWGRLDNVQRVAGGAGGPSFVFRTGPGRGTAETVGAPVPAGASLTLSYVVKPTAPDTQFQTAIYWYDAQGNFITQSIFDRWPGNVNAYTSYEHQIIPPANAVAYTLYTNGSGDFGGYALRVDALSTPADRKSYSVYDSAGRLAYAIDAAGAVTGYRYDAVGHVTGVVQYASNTAFMASPSKAQMDAWAQAQPSAATRVTRNFYAENGDLRFTIDAEGYVTGHEYDADGHVIRTRRYSAVATVADTLLSVSNWAASAAYVETSFRYDPTGRLVRSTGAEGGYTDYSYNANGTLLAETAMTGTANEVSTRYEYDGAGRITAEHRAHGIVNPDNVLIQQTTRYAYDGHGNVVEVTDPRLNKTLRSFDRAGRLLSETDAENGIVRYEYDAFGNAVKVTDKRGFTTYNYYDNAGRLIASRDPENYLTETSYTAFGEVASVTRRFNVVAGAAAVGTVPSAAAHDKDATTHFEYDRLGRVVKTIDAEGSFETYKLDAFGQRIEVRNKLGGVTLNSFDRRGLLVAETLPMSSVKPDGTIQATTVTNRFVYDARGNRTEMVEASGLAEARTTLYFYDGANRLTESRLILKEADRTTPGADTPRERYKYDQLGRLVETINALGGRTFSYYDKLGRLVEQIDPAGAMISWRYDAASNVIHERRWAQKPTSAEVGTHGWPTVTADDRVTNYTYDKLNRVQKTDRINPQVNAGPAKVVTGAWNGSAYVTAGSDLVVSYEYDAHGNVTRQTDASGNSVYSYYDKAGRRVEQVDQEGYMTSWRYDSEGNVIHERRWAQRVPSATVADHGWPVVTADDRCTEFTYDRNGRRLTESRWVDGANYGAGQRTITYTYNGLDQVTSKQEATGDTTTYIYDLAGRLETEKRQGFVDHSGAAVSPTTNYRYDGLNNLVRTAEGMAGERVTRYVYGAGGRLASMTNAAGGEFSYVYDAAGNKIRESYVRRQVQSVNAQGVVTYRDLTEAVIETRDVLGRVTGQALASWNGSAWVNGDRQDTAYNSFGEVSARGTNGLWQEQFAYNAAGQLTATNSGGGVWRYFVYDNAGNQTLAVESEGTDLAGKTLDQVLALARGNGAWAGATYVDGINTTITIVDKRGQATTTAAMKRQLSATVSAVDIATTKGYNAFGEVAWEKNAEGAQTSYVYNTMGRVRSIVRPTVSVTSENGTRQQVAPTEYFSYDLSGRLTGTTDANGNVTTRQLLAGTGYGGSEALVTVETHADGGVSRIIYDQFGDARVIRNELETSASHTLRSVHDETRNYDNLGRLVLQTERGGLTHAYTYDLLGRRILHTNTVLGAANAEITDYDLQGRVTRQVAFGGDTTTTSYAWDATLQTAGVTVGGWATTTTLANTLTSVEKEDVFGHALYKKDLGGRISEMTYDKAGRLTARTGAGAMTWTWLNSGLVDTITATSGASNTQNWSSKTTSHGYDVLGNLVAQYTVDTVEEYYQYSWEDGGSAYYYDTERVSRVVQNATADYDTLGRLVWWSEAGTGTAPAARTDYEYDANGNIRRTLASYRALDTNGTASTSASTQDLWYRYDKMNRVTTAKGSLQNGQIVGGEINTYNVAGQRKTTTKTVAASASIPNPYDYDGTQPYIEQGYEGQRLETYVYDAAGNLDFVYGIDGGWEQRPDGTIVGLPPSGTGSRIADYDYDGLGRVTRQLDYDASGTVVQYQRDVTYNAKSQITGETTNTRRGADIFRSIVVNNYGTGTAYALGAVVWSTSQNDKFVKGTTLATGSANPLDTRTDNTIGWYDGAVTTQVRFDENTGSTSNTIFRTTYNYNDAGQLQSAQVNDGRPRTVTYTNDMTGQVIRRDEADNKIPTQSQPYLNGDPHEVWYRFGGKQMGYVGNNGTLDTDYQSSVSNRTATAGTGAFRNGGAYGGAHADFDLSTSALTSYSQGGSGGSYTVQGGETLTSIAAQLWGDASLWYKLAEANGLSASNALMEGQRLTIPAGVMKNTHNASTFKPYDPAEAMGETSPTTPKPQTQKSNKCGVFGQILLIAVAVAVSVYTGGALAGTLGNALGSTFLGGVAAGAVGGAVGSIASQGLGVATGIQQGFSWKGVALAAIGGAVGGAMKGVDVFGKADVGLVKLGNDVARGAISNVASQGIGIATTLQSKFDWTGVAIGGVVAGAVGLANRTVAGLGVGALAGSEQASRPSFGNMANQAISGAAGALAGGAARSLATGTSFGDNVLAALPDVIGSTIGNALAGAVQRQPSAMGGPLDPGEVAPAAETIDSGSALGPDGEIVVTGYRSWLERLGANLTRGASELWHSWGFDDLSNRITNSITGFGSALSSKATDANLGRTVLVGITSSIAGQSFGRLVNGSLTDRNAAAYWGGMRDHAGGLFRSAASLAQIAHDLSPQGVANSLAEAAGVRTFGPNAARSALPIAQAAVAGSEYVSSRVSNRSLIVSDAQRLYGSAKSEIQAFQRLDSAGKQEVILRLAGAGTVEAVAAVLTAGASRAASVGRITSAAENIAPRTIAEFGACFVAGTQVHTPEGLAAIEKLRPGDLVLAQPELGGERSARRIVRVVSFEDKSIWTVSYRDDTGRTETLRATPNHPFWVEGLGWTAAELLQAGQRLQLADGTGATVVAIAETGTRQSVFNFEVEGFHTYYVGELGVWVHNTNCAMIAPGSLPAIEENAVVTTLQHIDAGTMPAGSLAKKWGTQFKNWAGDLPGNQGPTSPYAEYRVAPSPGTSGAGTNRVVVNSQTGEAYYTWTHYGDTGNPPFVQIR
ncbi:polymorphic toxin-type HINT domain-containing protein [Allosphingosinicella deserti]|uniref:LysM domain-containing protein n=1 Tax=Allosphingosinicella deserti TaxID=2116704 RepID=A0A2P7QW72_9SPHN|nr:polymorphic toxin-type HINT domain-containing protein [Sphingomonas deserti]PSJ42216.1 hypothetical protein C7I55_08260 [Sphingomonas deserti]